MSIKDGRDYLYLVWKNPETRRQYVVGELSKNGEFEFKYCMELEEAIKHGFQLLLAFKDKNKIYVSEKLFPTFSSRLPDRKRIGIEKILKKYGLTEYDEFQMLKRSGAKLPIDNLEFIDPILNCEEGKIVRTFFVAGPRHYLGCKGKDCERAFQLEVGDNIYFEFEESNPHDENAIKLLSENRCHIGYIPRYYTESLKKCLKNDYEFNCKIYDIQKNNSCNECIKAKFELKK